MIKLNALAAIGTLLMVTVAQASSPTQVECTIKDVLLDISAGVMDSKPVVETRKVTIDLKPFGPGKIGSERYRLLGTESETLNIDVTVPGQGKGPIMAADLRTDYSSLFTFKSYGSKLVLNAHWTNDSKTVVRDVEATCKLR